MSSTMPQLLARSARSARTCSSLLTSSAVASTSAAVQPARTFATTSGNAAGADARSKRPKMKQKVSMNLGKKGPTAPKRRLGGEEDTSQKYTNRFYVQRKEMEHLPTIAVEDYTAQKSLNTIRVYSQQQMSAFQTLGIENKVSKALASHIRPVTLIRQATAELISRLRASTSSPDSEPSHIVLTGPLSSGKSHLILQAVAWALASDWVVLYLPRLLRTIDAYEGFVYSEEQQAYLQPEWVRKTLANTLAVNRKALQKIKVSDGKGTQEWQFEDVTVSPETTLAQLLETVAQNSLSGDAVQQAFDLFLASLSAQKEVPTLVAVDNYQALFQTSEYRTPDMLPVESYELAPLRSLIQFLAGFQGQGVKRGAVIGGLTQQNPQFPVRDELQVAINDLAAAQKVTLEKARDIPAHTELQTLHLEHARACLAKSSLMDISGRWSREELKQLYEVRRQEGRNWNGGNADEASRRRSAMDAIPGAFESLPGQPGGVVSEDELFMMRLIDSGGNPAKFEASVRGGSTM